MRVLHISDLHLGKRLNEFSLLDDQAYILQAILDKVDALAPQAVVIAGDVYDKPLPPAEAVSRRSILCRAMARSMTWV